MASNVPALVNKAGERIHKGRISPALASAITLIVHEGLSHEAAANRVDMARESLSKALKKPHVLAFQAGVKRAWLASKTQKAWLKVAELADSAGSEKVQLEAAKTILTAAGELSGDDGGPPQTGALIQIIRNEFHQHGAQHSLSQRLPGVVQSEPFQEGEYEALDHEPGLMGPEDS